MQTHLSDDLVRKYQEDGFLHVPQLLAPAEVAELKSAVADAFGAMKRSKGDGRSKGDVAECHSVSDYLPNLPCVLAPRVGVS